MTHPLHFFMRREKGSPWLPSLLPARVGMGGGHDHTLPFLKLRKAEYHSQKEDGKVDMASAFSPPGKWRSVVIVTLHHSSGRGEETMLPLLAVGSGIGVVEAIVPSRVLVPEGRDLEAAHDDGGRAK